MTAVCPSCGAEQSQSLLCHTCTTRLERALGDVDSIVADVEITLSKQARIGNGGKQGKGSTHEKWPIDMGALEAGDNLANVLSTWARDVGHLSDWGRNAVTASTNAAVAVLLHRIDDIRRHPAVNELTDEIHDAIAQARRVVDRPADRIYLGQCYVETPGENGEQVTCFAELWARPQASEIRCRVCSTEHPVLERRVWLMERASDMIVSAKEAASYLGEVGGITVTQASIRGFVHRKKLAYRAPVDAKRFRLGDLLALLIGESERRSA